MRMPRVESWLAESDATTGSSAEKFHTPRFFSKRSQRNSHRLMRAPALYAMAAHEVPNFEEPANTSHSPSLPSALATGGSIAMALPCADCTKHRRIMLAAPSARMPGRLRVRRCLFPSPNMWTGYQRPTRRGNSPPV